MRKFVAAGVVMALVGCASTDPYTGEQKTSNTAKGAAVGAVVGAAVGVATSSKKDRSKGALTGAVAGGAIGGGVGFYMDKQEAALRQELVNSGVQVERNGDTIRLVMPGNITFATGRYEIRGDFYPTLNSLAQVLNKFEKTAIAVVGHTDSVGNSDSNQVLSEQRAGSVKQYLTGRGIAMGRIQSSGAGERYPIASNDSESGRQINRRVELELQPL